MFSNTEFLNSIGRAALNSLWQFALLWLLCRISFSVFRTLKAPVRFWIISGSLLAGFFWFIFSFFMNSGIGFALLPIFSPFPNLQRIFMPVYEQLLPAAATLYLFFLVFSVFGFIKSYRYSIAIQTTGLLKIAPEWRLFVQRSAGRMGIRQQVKIFLSEWVASPVTVGLLKPVILIPLAALNNLSTEQMEAVLIHELSHIKRFDYLLNLLVQFVRTILYFNPFVRSLVRMAERERETSSDETVLQFQYDPHRYAAALLSLGRVAAQPASFLVGAGGKISLLYQRIELILGSPKRNRISVSGIFSQFGIITLFAFLQFILLNRAEPLKQHLSGSSLFISFVRVSAAVSESDPYMKQQAIFGLQPKRKTTNGSITETLDNGKYLPRNKQQKDPLHNVVAASMVTIPETVLTVSEEQIVQDAIQSVKKISETIQWQQLEPELADAFVNKEKEILKSALQERLEQENWALLEHKIRLSFDKIDWASVQPRLWDAVQKIKTDSMLQISSEHLMNLASLQQQLEYNSQKGFPDSELTLKVLKDKQIRLQTEIKRLKKISAKKIVKL